MIPYTIDTHNFWIPTSYNELTLKQFLAIRNLKEDNSISILSILSGLDRSVWEQCTDLSIGEKLLPYIEYFKTPFNVESYLPDYLSIDGKSYKRPKAVDSVSFGQVERIKEELSSLSKVNAKDFESFGILIAIMMQPIIDNSKYNYERVNEILPLVMDCKLEEAWPLGSFFLMISQRLLKKKQDVYNASLVQKSEKQGLKDSQSLESGQQFSVWRKPLIALQKMFSRWITRRYLLLDTTGLKNKGTKKNYTTSIKGKGNDRE